MQKIEVAVQPDCFSDVSEALRKAKIGPFRASEVTSVDPAAPVERSYRGATYASGRERVKLAIDAIREGIDALGEGDAELVVLKVEDAVRLSPSTRVRSRATR